MVVYMAFQCWRKFIRPAGEGLLRSAARHTQLGELRRNHFPMRGWIYLLVDVQDPSVEADVEGPPRREGLIVVDDAVGPRDGFGRVAQERIVNAQRLRKRLVGFGSVDTDRKVRDVEAPDLIATLTE